MDLQDKREILAHQATTVTMANSTNQRDWQTAAELVYLSNNELFFRSMCTSYRQWGFR